MWTGVKVARMMQWPALLIADLHQRALFHQAPSPIAGSHRDRPWPPPPSSHSAEPRQSTPAAASSAKNTMAGFNQGERERSSRCTCAAGTSGRTPARGPIELALADTVTMHTRLPDIEPSGEDPGQVDDCESGHTRRASCHTQRQPGTGRAHASHGRPRRYRGPQRSSPRPASPPRRPRRCRQRRTGTPARIPSPRADPGRRVARAGSTKRRTCLHMSQLVKSG